MNRENIAKLFPSCLAANIILFFGMLTTNRLYIDDIGRSMRGYSDWTELGARPLADLVISVINLGHPLINTFPLPQLLSICLVTLACVSLAAAFSIESRTMAAICTLPLAGQPYFLENMSYTFDSPFMALALLLCVLSAIELFSNRRYKLLYAPAMLFAALNSYQAALGAFFVIGLFLLIKQLETAERPPRYLIRSFFNLVFASVVSNLVYLPFTKLFHVSAYVTHHQKIVGVSDAYSVIMGNMGKYIDILWSDWHGNAIGWIFVLVGAFTLCVAAGRAAKLKPVSISGSRKQVAYALLAMGVAAVTWLAAYFPQYLLEEPKWDPRTFCGFGAVLSGSCLYIYSGTVSARDTRKGIWFHRVSCALIGILAFSLVTFTYAFSKANTEQMFFEDGILIRIADDVETLDYSRNMKYLSYAGEMQKNPLLLNSEKKFPLLGRLVPILLQDNWIWGYREMTFEGINQLEYKSLHSSEVDSLLARLSPSISNTAYSIYLNGEQIIIQFHKK